MHGCLAPWGTDKMADIWQTLFFNYIFFNEKYYILIKISLNFVPNGQIDNKSPLAQVIVWK